MLKSTDPDSTEKREIVQYHFTSWPDHWVPRDTAGFLMFHHKLKQVLRIDPGPVIVHCRSVVMQTTEGYVMSQQSNVRRVCSSPPKNFRLIKPKLPKFFLFQAQS